ncbi:MAG: hypothetical protein U1C33_01140, partial [Candidatus Cloacimonadaceae bacterium]|nr:hypothetical protein [Candidatus Cloacimonadaceae bacterium]
MSINTAEKTTAKYLMDAIRHNLDAGSFLNQMIRQTYVNQNGSLYYGDSVIWLKTIPDSSIDLVFADPPYNIKKADWDYFQGN